MRSTEGGRKDVCWCCRDTACEQPHRVRRGAPACGQGCAGLETGTAPPPPCTQAPRPRPGSASNSLSSGRGATRVSSNSGKGPRTGAPEPKELGFRTPAPYKPCHLGQKYLLLEHFSGSAKCSAEISLRGLPGGLLVESSKAGL